MFLFFSEAARFYPEIVERYLEEWCEIISLQKLNSAVFSDGSLSIFLKVRCNGALHILESCAEYWPLEEH